ncbi:prephenate dehydratase [Pontibacter chitinilyticus]|uniref:prephenate dehydratase n=1 Tax=Pontibacter chitinilyticus TaxID=2674989 RepID=UPI00321AAADA
MSIPIKIAIQGGPASFHDTAARQLFGEAVEVLPCATFRQLCDSLQQQKADFAVMAIENLLVGSLLTNYSLLQEYDFQVWEELWLPIQQNLMALPGQQLQDITTVMSHPVALQQCAAFLTQHSELQPQESTDTADSAREIQEKQLYGVAAIASKLAAELYGLEILQANIADRADNSTRFLLLSRKPRAAVTAETSKVSLILQLPLTNGAFNAAINQLNQLQLHITLLQSLPMPLAHASHYVAVDLECTDENQTREAIEAIRPFVQNLKVLGRYPSSPHPLLVSQRKAALHFQQL